MVKDTTKTLKVKERYKLNNWAEYNESLKKRGSLTIWFDDNVKDNWLYNSKQKPGGEIIYSDAAIEFCLTIRSLFRLPYRQTEGMVKSLMAMSGMNLPVPSYTQFNRRTKRINIKLSNNNEDVHVIFDSTGLKVYGEGEWKVRKHGWSKHRTWRKMHLAINADTLAIEAVTMTGNDADDGSQVKPLLNAIKGKVISVRGDGGYDKKKVRQQLSERGIKQIIPPQDNAVIKDENEAYAQQRNEAIKRIKETDRTTWKEETEYHRRSLVEVAMFRYKTIFTGTLQSRKVAYENKEVAFKCLLLNKMNDLGMPKSYRVT
jgi:IS5 family transposase